MALPTYLDLINDVLVRLREPAVGSINENNLSALVGKFINDAKRQVEDAYNWNALTATLTVVTIPSVFNYGLVSSGSRFKVLDVYNQTSLIGMESASTAYMNEQFITAGNSPTMGSPFYYNFNGITAEGDTQVDILPVPEKPYTLFFNMYVPQEELTTNSEKMLVPKEPVILLAYARSLVERGEDGGLNSSEAYSMYKSSLADAISLESSRYGEEECWTWS
jgi:hypothetical protein